MYLCVVYIIDWLQKIVLISSVFSNVVSQSGENCLIVLLRVTVGLRLICGRPVTLILASVPGAAHTLRNSSVHVVRHVEANGTLV